MSDIVDFFAIWPQRRRIGLNPMDDVHAMIALILVLSTGLAVGASWWKCCTAQVMKVSVLNLAFPIFLSLGYLYFLVAAVFAFMHWDGGLELWPYRSPQTFLYLEVLLGVFVAFIGFRRRIARSQLVSAGVLLMLTSLFSLYELALTNI